MRILFVDDEPRVLSGIENSLLLTDYDWEADFVDSGHVAIERLADNAYDVVVTDMKMPGANGADVLEHLIATHPDTIRIILSGEVDRDLAERAMPLAHEFVSKPCDPGCLFQVIDRIHRASLGSGNEAIRGLLATLDRLPAQPRLLLAINQAMDDDAGPDVIAGLIADDLAVASKVIKTANSAFYGFEAPASTIEGAVMRLGMQTIAGIVLNLELSNHTVPGMEASVTKLNLHAARVGNVMRRLLGQSRPEAGLVGLVHDIGRLALIVSAPDDYRRIESEMSTGVDIGDLERSVFGATHAEIGAFMLELWRFAPTVVGAVRHHHGPLPDDLDPDAAALIGALDAVQAALRPNREPHARVDRVLLRHVTDLLSRPSRRMEFS